MERVTVMLENKAGYRPRDAGRLRRLIASLGRVKSVNVRVAPSHIEVDMVSGPEVLRALEEALGEARPLSGGDPPSLAREQRFWEAHEVLEEEWRASRDIRVKAIILAMAALAKAQEGRLDAALRITARIPPGAGVDRGCIEEAARRVYIGHRVDPVPCIGVEGWR